MERFGVYNGQRVAITKGKHAGRTATIIGMNNGWLYRLQDGDVGAVAFFAGNAMELQQRYGIFDGRRGMSLPIPQQHRIDLVDRVYNPMTIPDPTITLDLSRQSPAAAFLFIKDKLVVQACYEALVELLRRPGLSPDPLAELAAAFPKPNVLKQLPGDAVAAMPPAATPDIASPAEALPFTHEDAAAAAAAASLRQRGRGSRSGSLTRKSSMRSGSVTSLRSGGGLTRKKSGRKNSAASLRGRRRGRGSRRDVAPEAPPSECVASVKSDPFAPPLTLPTDDVVTENVGEAECAEPEVVLLELLKLLAQDMPPHAPRLRVLCELMLFLTGVAATPDDVGQVLFHDAYPAPSCPLYANPYTEVFVPPDHPTVKPEPAPTATPHNHNTLSNVLRQHRLSTGTARPTPTHSRTPRLARLVDAASAAASPAVTPRMRSPSATSRRSSAPRTAAAPAVPPRFDGAVYPYDLTGHLNNHIKALLGDVEARLLLRRKSLTPTTASEEPGAAPPETPTAEAFAVDPSTLQAAPLVGAEGVKPRGSRPVSILSPPGGGGDAVVDTAVQSLLAKRGTIVDSLGEAALGAASAELSPVAPDAGAPLPSWAGALKLLACVCFAGPALQPTPEEYSPSARAAAPVQHTAHRVVVASFAVPAEYCEYYAALVQGEWVALPFMARGWWAEARAGADGSEAPVESFADIRVSDREASPPLRPSRGGRGAHATPAYPPAGHNVVLVFEGERTRADVPVLGGDRYPASGPVPAGAVHRHRQSSVGGAGAATLPSERAGGGVLEAPGYRNVGSVAMVPPLSCWTVERVVRGDAPGRGGQRPVLIRLRESKERPGVSPNRGASIMEQLEFDFSNAVKRVRAVQFIKPTATGLEVDTADDEADGEDDDDDERLVGSGLTPMGVARLGHFGDVVSRCLTVKDAAAAVASKSAKRARRLRREHRLRERQDAVSGGQYLPSNGVVCFDKSDAACKPFGFYSGQRCIYRSEVQSTKRTPTTVLGVWGSKLWHHPDGEDIKYFYQTKADALQESLVALGWDDLTFYPVKMHTAWDGAQYNTEEAVTKYGQYHGEVVACTVGAWQGKTAVTLGCTADGDLARRHMVGGALFTTELKAQRQKEEVVEHVYSLNFAPRFNLLLPGEDRDEWVGQFQMKHEGVRLADFSCGLGDEPPSASGFDVRFSVCRPHAAHHGETVLILVGFDTRCTAKVLGVRDGACHAVLRSGHRTGSIVALQPNTFVRISDRLEPAVDPYALLTTHPRYVSAAAAEKKAPADPAFRTHHEYMAYFGEYVDFETSHPVMNVFRLYHGQRLKWRERGDDAAPCAATVVGVWMGELWRIDDGAPWAEPWRGSASEELMERYEMMMLHEFVTVRDVIRVPNPAGAQATWRGRYYLPEWVRLCQTVQAGGLMKTIGIDTRTTEVSMYKGFASGARFVKVFKAAAPSVQTEEWGEEDVFTHHLKRRRFNWDAETSVYEVVGVAEQQLWVRVVDDTAAVGGKKPKHRHILVEPMPRSDLPNCRLVTDPMSLLSFASAAALRGGKEPACVDLPSVLVTEAQMQELLARPDLISDKALREMRLRFANVPAPLRAKFAAWVIGKYTALPMFAQYEPYERLMRRCVLAEGVCGMQVHVPEYGQYTDALMKRLHEKASELRDTIVNGERECRKRVEHAFTASLSDGLRKELRKLQNLRIAHAKELERSNRSKLLGTVESVLKINRTGLGFTKVMTETEHEPLCYVRGNGDVVELDMREEVAERFGLKPGDIVEERTRKGGDGLNGQRYLIHGVADARLWRQRHVEHLQSSSPRSARHHPRGRGGAESANALPVVTWGPLNPFPQSSAKALAKEFNFRVVKERVRLGKADAFLFPRLDSTPAVFDISVAGCTPFGMYHAERYFGTKGAYRGVTLAVVGVREGSLWVVCDRDDGAVPFDPAGAVDGAEGDAGEGDGLVYICTAEVPGAIEVVDEELVGAGALRQRSTASEYSREGSPREREQAATPRRRKTEGPTLGEDTPLQLPAVGAAEAADVRAASMATKAAVPQCGAVIKRHPGRAQRESGIRRRLTRMGSLDAGPTPSRRASRSLADAAHNRPFLLPNEFPTWESVEAGRGTKPAPHDDAGKASRSPSFVLDGLVRRPGTAEERPTTPAGVVLDFPDT
eukprot:TRINITY_DN3664_c0_g1_i1.p1 TRINITY_DN3664_c0_g1~~TRINITY_DN3664_c0_g1_i1.p1  ORF type:complete len:2202 (+),score=651.77 TRINITY_DN3664_c0_g1_i1:173-6607(+)